MDASDVSLAISLLALVLTGLGYYENRRSNNIQLRQALALEESNRIAVGEGGEAMAAAIPNAPIPFTPNRWPALVLFVLLLMNLGVTGFDYYIDCRYHPPAPKSLTAAQPTPNPVPSSIDGTRDVTGNVSSLDIDTPIKMPYEVFCWVDWNGVCFLTNHKQGAFTVEFSTPSPSDGDVVKFSITPEDPSKAYEKQNQIIEKLNHWVAVCNRGMSLQKTEDGWNFDTHMKSWSGYHDRVVAVIDEIEKGGCTPQTNNTLEGLRNAPPQ